MCTQKIGHGNQLFFLLGIVVVRLGWTLIQSIMLSAVGQIHINQTYQIYVSTQEHQLNSFFF
jgi:hypothetical protein